MIETAAGHAAARGSRLLTLVACALLLTAGEASGGGGELRGIPEVIDGDTLELRGRQLRLTGVDAPELAQRCRLETRLYDCGQVARSALLDLTAGAEVVCRLLDADTPEPTPALCTAAGYDLSEGMTYTGWALANPEAANPEAANPEAADPEAADPEAADPEAADADATDANAALYRREESRARAAGRGLWRGRFVAPWDWREGARLAEEAE